MWGFFLLSLPGSPVSYYRKKKITIPFSKLTVHPSDPAEITNWRSTSSPPAFPSFASPTCWVQLFRAVVVSLDAPAGWAPPLHPGTSTCSILTAWATHMLPQGLRQDGSLVFCRHNIPILDFISLLIQRGDQGATTANPTNSMTRNITFLWKQTCISCSRAKLRGGDETKPYFLLGEGSMHCGIETAAVTLTKLGLSRSFTW